MANKFLLTFFLSTLLISCSGGGSSNNESRSNTSRSNTTSVIRTEEGTTITSNDVEIQVDTNGVPTIVNDPSGGTTITSNPNGGSTIRTGDGAEILISPDGFVTSVNSNGLINSID